MTAPQQFLTETRERFLKTILGKVPAAQIRELYLFQPIRQGGVESGVAVVAAYEETASAVDRRPSSEESASTVDRRPSAEHNTSAVDRRPSAEHNTSAVDRRPSAVTTGGADAEIESVELAEVTGPVAEGDSCEVAVAADGLRPTADAVQEKYIVYTARYRHTLKGPDRGKWEASIVAEAEAPLLSIESVVRGVQRRAGDVDAADHMTAAELRAALRLEPAPSRT